MANEYADLVTMKNSLNIETADETRDALLGQALTSASRSIDSACGRRFHLDDEASARIYSPRGRTLSDDGGARLLCDDVGSLTDLAVETGTTGAWTAVTDYETAPDNALVRGRPVTALVRPSAAWAAGTERVRVTARWGWPEVPDDIVQATLIQAARLYRRKDSPEGVTGSAEWGVVRLSRRDPDVWALIEHFIAPGFG